MLKRNIVILLVALMSVAPMYAQKFSKKEQARREAREANYFCGTTFTITGGFVHSWLDDKIINPKSTDFDDVYRYGQYRQSFNLGVQIDRAMSRYWGLQAGLFYASKGGEYTHYRDQHLGYGPILLPEDTKKCENQMIELQLQPRAFLPLTKFSRLTLGAGMYIDRVVESADGFGKWDLGYQGSLTYELKHYLVGVTYQRSFLDGYIDNSKSKQNAIYVNIGYRLWK
ncbi:MAG: hypothetical protein Q4B58_08550 [Bacteroidales bacterium]|nr:hypothetical protein [Bacteroidales bacterium]